MDQSSALEAWPIDRYRTKDPFPLESQVREAVKASGKSVAQIARDSRVSLKTLRNFLYGGGGCHWTLQRVLNGLGLEVIVRPKPSPLSFEDPCPTTG